MHVDIQGPVSLHAATLPAHAGQVLVPEGRARLDAERHAPIRYCKLTFIVREIVGVKYLRIDCS